MSASVFCHVCGREFWLDLIDVRRRTNPDDPTSDFQALVVPMLTTPGGEVLRPQTLTEWLCPCGEMLTVVAEVMIDNLVMDWRDSEMAAWLESRKAIKQE